MLGTVAYLILLERKVASWVQDRIGPNRVGLGFGIIPWLKDKKMFGLGQPLADGLNLEAELFGKIASTADMKEGTAAFLQKRPAKFSGS